MTTFAEPLTLCIDYHIEAPIQTGPDADPYQHLPPGGRTASVLRLLLPSELRLLGDRKFDVTVEVTDSEQLWSAINVNLEWVLWRVPAMYNMDCERLIAKGVVQQDKYVTDSFIELQERAA